MHKIDLHIHSHHSDGKSSCRELIQLAGKHKVELVSITDHDTLNGLDEAIETAGELKIPYIAGIEISTSVEDMLHVLGYGINPKDEEFTAFVNYCNKKRYERLDKFVAQLNKHGIKITSADVTDISNHPRHVYT